MSISLAPQYWGRSFWTTMYSIAYSYPEEPAPHERTSANNFYSSMRYLIPCPECKSHYSTLLNQFPVASSTISRTALLRWLEKISAKIDESLGRDPFDVKELYVQMEAVSTIVDRAPALRAAPQSPPIRQQPRQLPVSRPQNPQPRIRRPVKSRGAKTVRRGKCNCGKS
jgi:hypothetical protein